MVDRHQRDLANISESYHVQYEPFRLFIARLTVPNCTQSIFPFIIVPKRSCSSVRFKTARKGERLYR